MCSHTIPPNTNICSSLKHITDNNLIEVYPNIYVVLKITLTILLEVASAERSYSKLKLIRLVI
jgi:hypothetical protein